MKKCETCGSRTDLSDGKCWWCGERLEGVRGPEQSLVRESRSDEQPDGAEERKERSDCSKERSGVRKIVELAELLRHIATMDTEARCRKNDAEAENLPNWVITHINGELTALRELREWLSDTAEKRSDLPNDLTLPPR